MNTLYKKGILINFIGPDGSGKDTAYKKILTHFPQAIQMREPGGCEEAELIRDVLLNPTYEKYDYIKKLHELVNQYSINDLTKQYIQTAIRIIEKDNMTGEAELFLYAASRSETNEKVVLPALENKQLILGRRSVACSMSYQGKARNLGMDRVWEVNQPAIQHTLPTLEILFDIDTELAMERLANRTEKQDRLDNESMLFHQKSREGYLEYYEKYCPYPYVIVDASKGIEELYQEVKAIVDDTIQKNI